MDGNTTSGINVEGNSTGATIANNVSVDNGINSPAREGNIYVHSSSVAGTSANYNLVHLTQTAGQTMYAWNAQNFATLAAMRLAFPNVEQNGIQDDPGWNSDFHLLAGSPAIDSANSGASGASACDAEGDERVDSGEPNFGAGPRAYDDRGAFEANSNQDC